MSSKPFSYAAAIKNKKEEIKSSEDDEYITEAYDIYPNQFPRVREVWNITPSSFTPTKSRKVWEAEYVEHLLHIQRIIYRGIRHLVPSFKLLDFDSLSEFIYSVSSKQGYNHGNDVSDNTMYSYHEYLRELNDIKHNKV